MDIYSQLVNSVVSCVVNTRHEPACIHLQDLSLKAFKTVLPLSFAFPSSLHNLTSLIPPCPLQRQRRRATVFFPYTPYAPPPIPFLFCRFLNSYRKKAGGYPLESRSIGRLRCLCGDFVVGACPGPVGVMSLFPVPPDFLLATSHSLARRSFSGGGPPATRLPRALSAKGHCRYLLCYAAVHSPAPSASCEGSHPRKHRKSFMERHFKP